MERFTYQISPAKPKLKLLEIGGRNQNNDFLCFPLNDSKPKISE
jgi:hypothetical protein